VVYTFHCQNLHGLLDGQAILLGSISAKAAANQTSSSAALT